MFHCVYIRHVLHPYIKGRLSCLSTFWLLWVVLQQTQMCKHFFGNLLLIFFVIYPKVRLLDHVVVLFLIFFEESLYCFCSSLYHFTFLAEFAEKAMASHSSTLAWKIPWTEEPGRLQSMGSRRVGHDWATSLSLFTFMRWRRKWQPTPVFLPGESQGWRSLVGCRPWGCTESDMTEVI